MDIARLDIDTEIGSRIKFYVETEKVEIARAFLYVLGNQLHDRPFGFMEDIFVEESHRGKGIGKALVGALVEEAKKQNCYKLIGTTRDSKPEVQQMYLRYGFKDWGMEFRMDLV